MHRQEKLWILFWAFSIEINVHYLHKILVCISENMIEGGLDKVILLSLICLLIQEVRNADIFFPAKYPCRR